MKKLICVQIFISILCFEFAWCTTDVQISTVSDASSKDTNNVRRCEICDDSGDSTQRLGNGPRKSKAKKRDVGNWNLYKNISLGIATTTAVCGGIFFINYSGSHTAEINKNEPNERLPIIFKPEHMLGHYVQAYNNEICTIDETINPDNCHVVGGSFTYYGARPSKTYNQVWIKGEDLNDDIGWGCAWRATLNLLNNVKDWLAKNRNIIPNINRDVSMWDIQKWTGLLKNNWLEPAENAEIFLRFLSDKDWYSEDQKKAILDVIGMRGRLYPGESLHKTNIIESNFRYKGVRLTNLRAYFKLDDLGLGSEPSIEQLKNEHRNTLNTFYSEVASNENVTADNFPAFNADTNPFPINIDDGTLARNIYGVDVVKNVIRHVFVGEVHVWDNKKCPFEYSGWKRTNEVLLSGKGVMVFEMFVKSK